MNIKLIAFDLDGTLTQHKTKLSQEHREVLENLQKKYTLVMVGAGMCNRIFAQMNDFPIDIIGNYGMQCGYYNSESKNIDIVIDHKESYNVDFFEEKITELRKRYGFENFVGNNVEYHSSGCITFPLLGTKANQEDKLSFDPDRKKRRKIYDEIVKEFPNYNVFIGGSSSFDLAPKPYNKYYALDLYCKEKGIKHSECVFVGDDYGLGGNDESVYKSDFNFIKIDNYKDFPKKVEHLLKY